MKFQNRKNTTAIWLNKFILTLVFMLLIILIVFVRWFNNPVLGIERIYWIFITLGVWLFIAGFQNLKQPCYIYFEDTADRLIIRYYPLRIINQKKNAIEINKKAFVKFETVKFFWGLHEKLIIYQRLKNGVAKYPAVSLSAVNKKDIEKIKEILRRNVKNV
jgi:hypothetical protein